MYPRPPPSLLSQYIFLLILPPAVFYMSLPADCCSEVEMVGSFEILILKAYQAEGHSDILIPLSKRATGLEPV
jgi:hypothetical protein